MYRKSLIAAAILIALAVPATAGGLTVWTFDSVPSDANVSTGTLIPLIGTGTAFRGPGVGAPNPPETFYSGYPNSGPDTNNSRWGVTPLAGATSPFETSAPALSRYVQFSTSTVGFGILKIDYVHYFSNTAVNTATVQYTTDGSTFVNLDTYTVSQESSTWYHKSYDLTAIPGVLNNANFAFRIAADFDPSVAKYKAARGASSVGTSGAWGFDNVIVPEPGSLFVLGAGIAGLFGTIRRRR